MVKSSKSCWLCSLIHPRFSRNNSGGFRLVPNLPHLFSLCVWASYFSAAIQTCCWWTCCFLRTAVHHDDTSNGAGLEAEEKVEEGITGSIQVKACASCTFGRCCCSLGQKPFPSLSQVTVHVPETQFWAERTTFQSSVCGTATNHQKQRLDHSAFTTTVAGKDKLVTSLVI